MSSRQQIAPTEHCSLAKVRAEIAHALVPALQRVEREVVGKRKKWRRR